MSAETIDFVAEDEIDFVEEDTIGFVEEEAPSASLRAVVPAPGEVPDTRVRPGTPVYLQGKDELAETRVRSRDLMSRYIMAAQLTSDPGKAERLQKDFVRESVKLGLLPKEGESLAAGIWRQLTEPNVNRGDLEGVTYDPEAIKSAYPGKKGEILAGIHTATTDAGLAFSSILGASTLSMGALPKTAQRVISGGFAVDMARHVPGQVGAALNAETAEDSAAQWTGAALSSAFALGAGKHAISPAKAPAAVLASELNRSVKGAELPAGEIRFGTPTPEEVARLTIERAEEVAPATAAALKDLTGQPEAKATTKTELIGDELVIAKPEAATKGETTNEVIQEKGRQEEGVLDLTPREQEAASMVMRGEAQLSELAPRLRARVRAAMEKTTSAEDALSSLKIDTQGKLFDAVQGIPVAAWNGSIDAVRLAIKGGRIAAEAVDEGIKWLKENHPELVFDEAEYRAALIGKIPKAAAPQFETQSERKGTTALRFVADSPEFQAEFPLEAKAIQERQYVAQTEKGRQKMAHTYLEAYRTKEGALDVEQAWKDLQAPDLMSGADNATHLVTVGRLANEATRLAAEAKNPIDAARFQRVADDALAQVQGKASGFGQGLQATIQAAEEMFGAETVAKARGAIAEKQQRQLTPDVPRDTVDQINDAVKKAGEEADKNPDVVWEKDRLEEQQKILLREFQKYAPLPKVSKKAKAVIKEELPKLVELANMGALNHEAFYNVLADKFGLPKFTPETALTIMRMADKVKAAPEGLARNKATTELFDYIKKQTGATKQELTTSWWYTSVLSGMGTQFVNTVGNAVMMLNEFGMMALREPTAAPKLIGAMLRGLVQNITSGELGAIMKGDMSGRIAKNLGEGSHVFEVVKDSPNPFVRLLSKGRFVTRFMVAVDSLFKDANLESKATFDAFRKSNTGDVTKADLDKAIGEMLKITKEDRAKAETQAESEVASGAVEKADRNRRVVELLRKQRPQDIIDSSEKFSLEATLNNEPDPNTFLGKIYQPLVTLRAKNPILTPFIPFLRVAVNVANQQLNHSPIGLYRMIARRPAQFRKGLPPESAYSMDEYQQLRAKVAISHAAGIAITGLIAATMDDEDPKFQLSGSGQEIQPEKKKQLMSEGWRPYGVKIGNTWYDYRYSPYATMFSSIGAVADGMRYGKLDEKAATIKFAAAIKAGYWTIIDQAALSTLADVLGRGTFTSSEAAPESFLRFVSRTAGGFIPTITKEVESFINPEIQQAEWWFDYFQRENPVGRWAIGRPMLNALGEPVERPRYPWRRVVSSENDDPVWQALAEKASKGVFMPVPSASAKVNGEKMSDEQFYEYQKAAGKLYRERLEQNLEAFKLMTPAQAEKWFESEFTKLRERARKGIK